MLRSLPPHTALPYTTLFRSEALTAVLDRDDRFEVVGTAATGREAVRLAKTAEAEVVLMDMSMPVLDGPAATDRKSTRLNSSHLVISYAVFCLKKKRMNN